VPRSPQLQEQTIVIAFLRHLKALPIALIVLALSASLAFGSYAPASGFSLGSTFQAGTDESAGDEVDEAEDTETDEDTDEDTETDEDTGEESESADNCLTDPTAFTEEELAAMSHGSIVCWAAQQETPEGYANHGAWVSQWAHMGKAKAAPEAAASGKSHGKGKGKGATKGH
jgi:hypothetical protein